MSNQVQEALDRAQEAKAAYRADPSLKDEHRAAATELRYQRWVARGGPAGYELLLQVDPDGKAARAAADMYQRFCAEREG